MNRKRIILLLTLCVAFTLAAQGQRFDWVRTFTGQDVSSGYVTNRIVGSCVDRDGNYYFIGQCSPYAQLCGVRILPDSIITYPLHPAVVIAKLSPQGNLLWHKAIYSPGGIGSYTRGLRQLGDTAFMVQAYFALPYEFYAYNSRIYRDLYYLDSLIPGNNTYPMPLDSVALQPTSAYITFKNDGTVIEQHFICVGGVDSTGHALTPRYMGLSNYGRMDGLYNDHLNDVAFGIDSAGNIYVVRRTCDQWVGPDYQVWNIADGGITALKILVDGTHSFYCPTERSSLENKQILKFSPHFDSLLASTYVFDSTWLLPHACFGANDDLYDLNMDSHGNLYLNLICDNIEFPLRVSGSNTLFMDTIGIMPSVIIKYNSNLQPIALAQLSFTGSGLNMISGRRRGVDAYLMHPHIDDESNSVFLTGLVAWAPAPNAISTFTLFYNGDTIDVASKDGFWLRLDMDDLRLLSLGKIRHYANDDCVDVTKLTTQHNRVFGHSKFVGGIIFNGTPITCTDRDHAFLVWDYDGNELFGTSFHHGGTTTKVHQPRVMDSMVYLSGSFIGNATFGTTGVLTQGTTYAYITKYVDTSFMTPYVVRDTRTTQQINWPQVLSFPLSDSLVQLTATSTSGLPISYTCSDTSIARVVGTTLRLLAEGDATITASQGGNNQYLPATPVTKTLHVSRAVDTLTTQQINWPQELSFSLPDSPVQLTARSTSGLSVTYTCSDTSIARIWGTTLYLMAEGDATITASQGGNSQYRPATPVSKNLHVGQTVDTDTLTAQQINWQQELTFPLSDDPIPLTATSSSGLPVTYTCNNPNIALIVGSTLYLRAEGEATVTASQRGNSQYHPATPVVKPLRVGHAGIDVGDSHGFAIYPNPARNAVRYSTNEPVKSIQVISSQGRTMEVSFTGNQVDITTLPAGVYYLRFVTESNVYSHKIIKM